MQMFQDEFYTMGEIAKALKVSRATVLRRVRDGTLPPPLDGINRFLGENLRRSVGSGRRWVSVSDPEPLGSSNADSS